MLEGENLLMSVDKLGKYGFFTTRFVRASDPNSAFVVAKELVINELISSAIKKNAPNDPVSLRASEIRAIGWWEYFRNAPGKGFTFFLEDESEGEGIFL